MGIGVGAGEYRTRDALKRAMESPLMETSIHGAKGVILNVTASPTVGIIEVQDASAKLQEIIDPDANFIWGLVYDESMGEEIQMVVIATGFELDEQGSGAFYTGAKKESAAVVPDVEESPLFSVDSPIDTPSYLRRRTR